MQIAKSVYTGVDYVRLTANDHKPAGAWRDVVLPEFVAEEKAGRKPHMRWLMGYYGRVGEHCFMGENDTGCMIQLSGALAARRWYDASNHSQKCTRIDIQVTWPCEQMPGDYIREQYEVAQLAPNREGKRAQLQLTDTPEGSKMLAVGSRQSEAYGRMYDKERESGMPEYKSCVRWEVEVKGQQAYDLCGFLRETHNDPWTVKHIVSRWWTVRGMLPYWDHQQGEDMEPPMKRSKTDQTKLAWLSEQVAPTMKLLKAHGKLAEAVRAVFGEALTEEQIEVILREMYNDVDD